MKIALVGNLAPGHVGASLSSAADALGIGTILCDVRAASAVPKWIVSMSWHLLAHRPPLLRRFSQSVLDTCRRETPEVLLTTGCAPVTARTLRGIGKLGVLRINFSTDDPWNPAHRSARLFAALKQYDAIFTPRRSNLEQLRELGVPVVRYLPFAFDPLLHFTDRVQSARQRECDCDVLFVGGADRDRLPVIRELIHRGFKVALYGGYWNRYRATRIAARGIADPYTIRRATQMSRLSLCMVRRRNRDGHVMRSFEMAALGACMLVEDTQEHREIFGEEGTAVMYFRSILDLTEKTRWLLDHPEKRDALSERSKALVAVESNTYAARLREMLEIANRRIINNERMSKCQDM